MRAMIEHMIARCRTAIDDCFSLDPNNTVLAVRLEAYTVGQRLMKTSLLLAAALQGQRTDFVHRIVVDRAPGEPENRPAHGRAPASSKR